eukprot:TRINITY_DN14149_c0_g1_i1.p1 TRINITY_DN14149_c0_g1~~TRINITY_DN14149_c0_g1_i1.p1  ORF type:complete len:748 (-),score=142.14 TRINITY_DN14149_c0_g1_i1:320-2563(-)
MALDVSNKEAETESRDSVGALRAQTIATGYYESGRSLRSRDDVDAPSALRKESANARRKPTLQSTDGVWHGQVWGQSTNFNRPVPMQFEDLLDKLGEVHRLEVLRLQEELRHATKGNLSTASISMTCRSPTEADAPPTSAAVPEEWSTRGSSNRIPAEELAKIEKREDEEGQEQRPEVAPEPMRRPSISSASSLGMDNFTTSPSGFRRFRLRDAWLNDVLDSVVDGCEFTFSTNMDPVENPAKGKHGGRGRRCQLINPFCLPKLCWDLVGLVFICYDLFMIPLGAFDLEDNLFTIIVGWASLLFWTADAILSFFVGYFDRGEMVTSPMRAICKHLRTWFWLDVIVVVPDWVLIAAGDGGDTEKGVVKTLRGMRVLRAVRVLRLLRLLRLQRILHVLYDSIDSEYMFIIVGLTKLLIFVLMLNHVIACLWYWVGWVAKASGELNWIQHAGYQPVDEEPISWKYSTALHWSLTQFTPASMDVSARNVGERVFSIVVLFSAMVIFSSIVGSITNSMTSIRNLSSEKQKQFWLLRLYLKQHKIPHEVKTRITKYLEYQSDKPSSIKEDNVKLLRQLSKPLMELLTYEVRIKHCQCHPFFGSLDSEFKPVAVDICHRGVHMTSVAGKDVIFRDGDEAREMRFVCSGEMEYQPSKVEGLVAPITEAIEWLSEPVLWTTWRHCGILVARTPAELLSVSPGPFAEAMRVHPRPWSYARSYAEQFLQFLRSMPVGSLTDVLHDEEFYGSAVATSPR